MASDRANPRIAYENSCCFRDGFLQRKEERYQHIYRTHKESISVIVKNKDTKIKTNLA